MPRAFLARRRVNNAGGYDKLWSGTDQNVTAFTSNLQGVETAPRSAESNRFPRLQSPVEAYCWQDTLLYSQIQPTNTCCSGTRIHPDKQYSDSCKSGHARGKSVPLLPPMFSSTSALGVTPMMYNGQGSLPTRATTGSKRENRLNELHLCGIPKFSCHECSKLFVTSGGLMRHRQSHCQSVESGRKCFSCKHCEKQYASLGALKMHIRTHTLPCKCRFCGKCFSRPWLLQGHIRTHTGEKPYLCAHCRRAFADRSNLRAHLQTHSEVKKYSCQKCAKTYSRMSLLTRHEFTGCFPQAVASSNYP